MLSINDLRAGAYLVYQGEPYVVLKHSFIKMAQSKGIMRTTLKNLKTGKVLEETFKGQEKLEEADIRKSKANYLYREGDPFFFMDEVTYDQFFVTEAQLGDKKDYLKENTEIEVLNFNDAPITIDLPKKMTLKVTMTAPGVRGDTAQGSVMKPATLETGVEISVPLFIKQDEMVIVNTETGEYVGKA
ncbi:MAG: elongation factor P [Patescibacteria group bacterium]|nr:elongation factor P [Patescibacteria group bacterium]